MIQLDKPVKEFWHPDGDKDGNPVKVQVDQAEIIFHSVDTFSNVIRVVVRYGYTKDGKFEPHLNAGGAMDPTEIVISDPDPRKPGVKAFTDFLNAVKSKGAPDGEFRKADLEDMIVSNDLLSARK
jgi:hypothetical protein